ncbi:anti-sigma B factor antagonist [Thermotomaculum hydrothermale]|uniref:Anti-sigma factor antagonist n=1 Tax=Thermotomaculum hydrothermale TaxID=981385 RepID=A0A7R6PPN4_9BACT|nr:STAS domain-containing protein [Thermotomaculum hydrothermale]BBB32066.1 anti-sigma B factor antagonist [Thermotomaculum hydrothermale]
MELEIKKERIEKVTVLKIKGAINAHTVNEFEKTLEQCVENREYYLLIDCKELDYISSAGLGALMGVIEKIKSNNGDIKLCNTSNSVYRVFDILGFTELFEIFNSLEEGLKAFKKNG